MDLPRPSEIKIDEVTAAMLQDLNELGRNEQRGVRVMIRITNEQARPGGIRRKHEIEVEAKSREGRRQELLYELAHLLKKIERHPDVVFVSGSQANIRLHCPVKIRASSGKQSEILRQLAIVACSSGG